MAIELKYGVLRDGKVLGNIKNGVVRQGTSTNPGGGKAIGNVKEGVIREGTSTNAGSGKAVGKVKDGIVRKGTSTLAGGGSRIGKVKDYDYKGYDSVSEGDAVAIYHFLIKEIF